MTTERKPRYELDFQVVYDDGEGFMSARVVDVSETGLFLETVMPLEPGKRVRITPLLPSSAGILELEGEVVRVEEYDDGRLMEHPPGMAVRFVDVGEEELSHLKKLLEGARAKR